MANPKYAYFEGKIVPISEAKVDIRTNALQYGTAVFEGIRSYWNQEQEKSYVFRLHDHYQRFLESARILMINLGKSIEELSGITLDLLQKEGYREDSYVRPYAYNSGLTIGPKLVGNPQDIFIYSIPLGKYLETSKPISVCTSSWTRINDNSIPPRAKIAGSYVNAALQKTEALLNGYDEAIVLTSDGQHVSEGSAMNIFMVKKSMVITPSITDDILEGVTRNTILELVSRELGLEVSQRSIDRTELYTADELFFCGTGAQVSPIGSVDKRVINDNQMGPITKKIQDLYFKIVKNEVEKYSHWCTPV
ncbi:MAG: branched-chain amino acid transaminase [Actinomycetota bacterium]|jgi:branched-chain amino acid aminotransferase|nr:branched-chain amino acid transaminase [Actinomycetota bacterium]